MTSLTPSIRSSKRKRAQVTYYDSDSSHEGEDDHDSDFSNSASTGQSKVGNDVSCDPPIIGGHPKVPQKKRKILPAKAPKSRPLPKKKIFPFMLLPPELRNRIYDLTLTAPGAIVLRTKHKNFRQILIRPGPPSATSPPNSYPRPGPGAAMAVSYRYPLQPRVLQLNKQINSEAQPFLYGTNRFWFANSAGMHCFLATVGTANVASLTHLSLQGYSGRAGSCLGYYSGGMDYPAMVLLVPARQLRVFEIGCSLHLGDEDELRTNAKGFYRMAYPWLDARAGSAVEALHLVEMSSWVSGAMPRGPMKANDVRIFKDELGKLMKSC